MKLAASLCFLATFAAGIPAQTPRVALLEIEFENQVSYRLDVPELARLATAPGLVSPVLDRGFIGFIGIGDVVAVNGKPAKGLWMNRGEVLTPGPAPAPTMAIANVASGNHTHCSIDLFTGEGVWVGRLADGALSGSTGPTHPILGGGGAFLGAAGEHGWARTITPLRRSSTLESPSLRQALGGGRMLARYYLIPRQWPEVEVTPEGPAVFHGADFSLVTAAKPARAGEVLIVRAKGLGPTRPNLVPAGYKPFGSDPLEEVNSPVEVAVNGSDAEVINKIGWPGTYDLYRVDVRVPAGVTAGTATLRLTAAWISGPEVRIPIQ
ncbi:MAG: hypothetical protein IT158_23045 [Bryobacterales bacterium]|nr:hypothetical protein [Bryobacterales bacterium]